ncbi:hypothetical protein ACFQVC_06510 [Streptomyces monticola]|uniref:Uncharacterized protein n=1 Tax=Streptomyces monticola TaxID=2666263 RepID=A0ABW2JEE5_9ACTN
MEPRSTRRPGPALATLVVGVLLACGYLLGGDGHEGVVSGAHGSMGVVAQGHDVGHDGDMTGHVRGSGSATGHADGAAAHTPAAARVPADADVDAAAHAPAPHQHADAHGAGTGDGCTLHSEACPLATAQSPAPLAAPALAPSELPSAGADFLVRTRAAACDDCARPRAPDPLSLGVSRT